MEERKKSTNKMRKAKEKVLIRWLSLMNIMEIVFASGFLYLLCLVVLHLEKEKLPHSYI